MCRLYSTFLLVSLFGRVDKVRRRVKFQVAFHATNSINIELLLMEVTC